MYYWKNLFMNFMTNLPISTNKKREAYNSILVIIDWLMKMGYYKPIKITIDAWRLAKLIIDMVGKYHRLIDLIMFDKSSLFISKFWLSLY